MGGASSALGETRESLKGEGHYGVELEVEMSGR